MVLYQLDLTAPIIPDHGLGGLVVRTKLTDIQDLVEGLGTFRPGWYSLVTQFEAGYGFDAGEVEAGVDVRNGKIARLVARAGYKGSLFDRVVVGMKVSEAFELIPGFYYDEASETVLCKDAPGVALHVSEIDPPSELVPMMRINAISVTPKELHTLAGQRGTW